jgi:hypothetical protein
MPKKGKDPNTINVLVKNFPKHIYNAFRAWCILRGFTVKMGMEIALKEKLREKDEK